MKARERESVLEPHRDKAQREAAELAAAVKDAEERAHAAYVRGDAAAGDWAHAEAADLKTKHAAAAAALEAVEHAVLVVSEQRRREDLEAQLAQVNMTLAEALAGAQRQAAEVRPALSAAKAALRRAQADENRARGLEHERFELEIALGMRERVRLYPKTDMISAMIESQRHLRDLLNDPEL